MLELSLREALQLGQNYISTEHILLGLIREGDGVAAQVLASLGADLTRVRRQVIEMLLRHLTRPPAPTQANVPDRSDEVERLRDLLRQYGTDPQDGVA